MTGNFRSRERKIDVNRLSPQQADQIAAQTGKEIAKIMDEANEKCNKLLKIYGVQTAISYKIVEL